MRWGIRYHRSTIQAIYKIERGTAQSPVTEQAGPIRRAWALVIRSTLPAPLITSILLVAALLVGGDEWVAAAILIAGAGLVAFFGVFIELAKNPPLSSRTSSPTNSAPLSSV